MVTEKAQKTGRLKSYLDIVATLAMIGASGAMIWAVMNRPQQSPRPQVIPAKPLPVDISTEVLAQGPVALVVYSDFQCPYCGQFARDILPTIEAEYQGAKAVQIQFRHLPLGSIHPRAVHVAQFAFCAGRQNKFREAHDLLFRGPTTFPDDELRAIASDLKLDNGRLEQCMSAQAPDAISSALTSAQALGVSSTPTIFVGKVESDGSVKVASRVQGAQLVEIRQALDGILK